jgi:hypothetical protein
LSGWQKTPALVQSADESGRDSGSSREVARESPRVLALAGAPGRGLRAGGGHSAGCVRQSGRTIDLCGERIDGSAGGRYGPSSNPAPHVSRSVTFRTFDPSLRQGR